MKKSRIRKSKVAATMMSHGIEMRKNDRALAWKDLAETDLEPLMGLCVSMHRQLGRMLFKPFEPIPKRQRTAALQDADAKG